MIELAREEYMKVSPLLKELKGICLSAHAVVEKNQTGHIFVNNQNSPSSCLIVNSGGVYLVAGKEDDTDFNKLISQFLQDKNKHLNYYDLYVSSESWLKIINNLLDGKVVKLSRTIYSFTLNNYPLLDNRALKIPENFTLKRMDEKLYNRFLHEVEPLYNKTWGSFKDFSSKGFGFCLLDSDKFASVCTSDYVADGFAGIDIMTIDEYRRKGFATITCSAFIEHCIVNNLIPIWSADSGNEPSNTLALKLGFSKVKDFDMLWWHENSDVIKYYLDKFKYS